jgi:hypothetical protein
VSGDPGMVFEVTMRRFFGDKADHIAASGRSPGSRARWLHKAVDRMLGMIDQIDTTVWHKERMMAEIGELRSALSPSQHASWEAVYRLFRLCAFLLGYGSNSAVRFYTPLYVQDRDQYFTEIIMKGGNGKQLCHEEQSAVAIRQRLVRQLKSEGLSDFRISLVLKTSDYEVKKLRRSPDIDPATKSANTTTR